MKNIFALCILCLLSFHAAGQGKKISARDVRKLAGMMTGNFSSEAQAKADSNFLHITLRMKPFRKHRDHSYWLYVEQALASRQDKPYRQRVYHLYQADDTTIVSKVFELPEPEKYAGAWESKSGLKALQHVPLTDRQGCSIFLRRYGKRKFSGTTPGRECLSSLRGAAYATSEVTITKEGLISWDRGWNDKDEQVWGSTSGGYVFKKVKP